MKKREPEYVIASTEIYLGRPISGYSTWEDKDDAKQALRAQISNLAIQFANNHSLDGINKFVDKFYFELPPEPPTNYIQEAEDDAAMLITDYFMDEIIDKIIDSGEASADINNDYDNGDGIFHEVITDRSYGLEEAAELLSQLYRYEEEDSGLWEGVDDLDSIAEIKAAYTYGNAVWSDFDTFITEINDSVKDIKANVAFELLDEKDLLNDNDTQESPGYIPMREYEMIDLAETDFSDEYEEKLREALKNAIENICE